MPGGNRYRRCRNAISGLFCNLGAPCLIVLFILAAIATAVVFIVIRYDVIPQVEAKVEDARLDKFQFARRQGSGSFFSYNISIALAIRNSNIVMSIRCTKPLVATFIFHDRRLSNVTVVGKGHKYRKGKTKLHCVNATGKVSPSVLGHAGADDFDKQNVKGVFKVEVRLFGEMTYQGIVIAQKRKLSMSCLLLLQLAPPGPEVVVFHQVNCKPVEQDKNYF